MKVLLAEDEKKVSHFIRKALHGWKKAYLKGQQPGQIDGQQQSPEQMAQTIRQLHKEVEYLKRQREILKKAMSIVGEEPNPGMR